MLKPADVQKMLMKQDNPVNMILEQANLGRGKHWYVNTDKEFLSLIDFSSFLFSRMKVRSC